MVRIMIMIVKVRNFTWIQAVRVFHRKRTVWVSYICSENCLVYFEVIFV